MIDKRFRIPALLAACFFVVPALAKSQEPAPKPETQSGQSEQPVGDAWITAKVKADLLASQDVSGLDIKVETENGAVRLSGSVDSQAQMDKAVLIARAIKGVRNVDASGLNVSATGGGE